MFTSHCLYQETQPSPQQSSPQAETSTNFRKRGRRGGTKLPQHLKQNVHKNNIIQVVFNHNLKT